MIKQLTQLINQLKQNHYRALVVLQGSTTWQEKILQHYAPQALRLESYQTKNLLGKETNGIIISAKTGILLETLAITSGTITAGNILWLRLPENLENNGFFNPASEKYLSYNKAPLPNFESYLIKTLKQHANWITETSADIKLPLVGKWFHPLPRKLNGLTNCQTTALDAILQLSQTDPALLCTLRDPLIITGKRGRGKTTLLGKAAAQLLHKFNLIITAPTYQQTATAFVHTAQELKVEIQHNQLNFQENTLSYKAPDDLLLNQPKADLLFIDEAANLPLPMLKKLLKIYPRTVLTTTLDGYEGTAQGFTQRLLPAIKQQQPNYQHLELIQPIRYNFNDPLESLIDTLLCQTEQIAPLGNKLDSLKIKTCKPTELTEKQLIEVVQLLQATHYQSGAGDLQQLLTAPDLTLHLAINSNEETEQTIGFLLTLEEGKIAPLEASRRVKGHLVPQLLRQNFALEEPLELLTSRATRLGVMPQFRRQKIATQLIEHWQKTENPDYFSLSFGATPELHQLWIQHNFLSVHLGTKRDKASATYNLVMLKPNNPATEKWINQLAQEFQQNLPNLLQQTHQDLNTPLPAQLQKEKNLAVEPRTFQLADFVNYPMPYESAEFKLQNWTKNHPYLIEQLTETEQKIWQDKLIKQLSWQELIQKHQLIGRKNAQKTFKEIAKKLISL